MSDVHASYTEDSKSQLWGDDLTCSNLVSHTQEVLRLQMWPHCAPDY